MFTVFLLHLQSNLGVQLRESVQDDHQPSWGELLRVPAWLFLLHVVVVVHPGVGEDEEEEGDEGDEHQHGVKIVEHLKSWLKYWPVFLVLSNWISARMKIDL